MKTEMRHLHGRGRPLTWMLALAIGACAGQGGTPASAAGIVTCDQLADEPGKHLRDLVKRSSSTFAVGSTDQEIRYLVIRPDSSVSTAANAIVFFNGTSAVMSDWPYEMLKGSDVSLCDAYTLIFFDYPGVGGTVAADEGKFTFDHFAENVDALVTYLNTSRADELGTTIDTVHPLGWSLGSLAALKFAALAGANGYAADDSRKIGNVFLIATKPGGDTHSGSGNPLNLMVPATGHQAQCVTQVTAAMRDESSYVKALKKAMFGLMFPYVYTASGKTQGEYAGSSDEICVADSISTAAVTLEDQTTQLDIETSCEAEKPVCVKELAAFWANRAVEPYKASDANESGVPYAVYVQERNIVDDWNYAYCAQAGASWTSEECYPNPYVAPPTGYTRNSANGGPCLTIAFLASNQPGSLWCMSLDHITGKLVVINAKEDMFIQHVYGTALYDAYKGEVSASLNTYSGSAGHAVLLTDPTWVQGILLDAMPTSRGGTKGKRKP